MYFDSIMKKSLAVLSAITFVIWVMPLLQDAETASLGRLAIDLVASIFFYWFVIFLLRHIRGNEIVMTKPPYKKSEIGVGGYVWRSILIKYLSLLPGLPAINLIFGGRPSIPSIAYSIVGSIIMMASAVLVTWAVFSKDRAGQFRWLLSLGRGY